MAVTVVLDTSVVVSTLGAKYKNNTLDIINLAERELIELFTSPAIWQELEDVLDRDDIKSWLGKTNYNYQSFVKKLKNLTKVVEVSKTIVGSHINYKNLESRDKKDLKFLYLLDSIKSDILITQDKDLLELESHNHTIILKPSSAVYLLRQLFGDGVFSAGSETGL
jgi:putative PIN family toxin of toxin-antitoxin system